MPLSTSFANQTPLVTPFFNQNRHTQSIFTYMRALVALSDVCQDQWMVYIELPSISFLFFNLHLVYAHLQ